MTPPTTIPMLLLLLVLTVKHTLSTVLPTNPTSKDFNTDVSLPGYANIHRKDTEVLDAVR